MQRSSRLRDAERRELERALAARELPPEPDPVFVLVRKRHGDSWANMVARFNRATFEAQPAHVRSRLIFREALAGFRRLERERPDLGAILPRRSRYSIVVMPVQIADYDLTVELRQAS